MPVGAAASTVVHNFRATSEAAKTKEISTTPEVLRHHAWVGSERVGRRQQAREQQAASSEGGDGGVGYAPRLSLGQVA